MPRLPCLIHRLPTRSPQGIFCAVRLYCLPRHRLLTGRSVSIASNLKLIPRPPCLRPRLPNPAGPQEFFQRSDSQLRPSRSVELSHEQVRNAPQDAERYAFGDAASRDCASAGLCVHDSIADPPRALALQEAMDNPVVILGLSYC